MKKLTEVEWITSFEQVQGRKPTPEELYKAHQDGLIAPRKNRRNLIILAGALLAILVAIVIVFTVNNLDSQEASSTSKSGLSQTSASSETSSSQQVKTSSTDHQTASSHPSSDSSATPDANHETEAYTEESNRWNSSKASQLASLMVTWGNSMNQPGYKEISTSLPLRWVGDKTLVNSSYASSGSSEAAYTIVAVYEYYYGGNSVHRYFFTIKADGSPLVLYSATTNGDTYYVKETENTDLKAGYADIVNQ